MPNVIVTIDHNGKDVFNIEGKRDMNKVFMRLRYLYRALFGKDIYIKVIELADGVPSPNIWVNIIEDDKDA